MVCSQINAFSIIIFQKRHGYGRGQFHFKMEDNSLCNSVCVSRRQQVVEASAVEGGVVRNNPALAGDDVS